MIARGNRLFEVSIIRQAIHLKQAQVALFFPYQLLYNEDSGLELASSAARCVAG